MTRQHLYGAFCFLVVGYLTVLDSRLVFHIELVQQAPEAAEDITIARFDRWNMPKACQRARDALQAEATKGERYSCKDPVFLLK